MKDADIQKIVDSIATYQYDKKNKLLFIFSGDYMTAEDAKGIAYKLKINGIDALCLWVETGKPKEAVAVIGVNTNGTKT